jgi:hypothetical protein
VSLFLSYATSFDLCLTGDSQNRPSRTPNLLSLRSCARRAPSLVMRTG